MEKPCYINPSAFNDRALAAVSQVAEVTGMSRSQAAVYLILKGAGKLSKADPISVQGGSSVPTADL